MDSISILVVVFVFEILSSQTIAWDENSLSRPVITRNHRRLKGFTFNTFHPASLVFCGLKCQRNPRCVSTNFRRVSSLDETEGVCELNDKGAVLPIEGNELEFDEEAVYIQFEDKEVRKFCYVYQKNENNAVSTYFINACTRSIKEQEFTRHILSNVSVAFSSHFSAARLSADRLLEWSLMFVH